MVYYYHDFIRCNDPSCTVLYVLCYCSIDNEQCPERKKIVVIHTLAAS